MKHFKKWIYSNTHHIAIPNIPCFVLLLWLNFAEVYNAALPKLQHAKGKAVIRQRLLERPISE
jgi:hypothetical protein